MAALPPFDRVSLCAQGRRSADSRLLILIARPLPFVLLDAFHKHFFQPGPFTQVRLASAHRVSERILWIQRRELVEIFINKDDFLPQGLLQRPLRLLQIRKPMEKPMHVGILLNQSVSIP